MVLKGLFKKIPLADFSFAHLPLQLRQQTLWDFHLYLCIHLYVGVLTFVTRAVS